MCLIMFEEISVACENVNIDWLSIPQIKPRGTTLTFNRTPPNMLSIIKKPTLENLPLKSMTKINWKNIAYKRPKKKTLFYYISYRRVHVFSNQSTYAMHSLFANIEETLIYSKSIYLNNRRQKKHQIKRKRSAFISKGI